MPPPDPNSEHVRRLRALGPLLAVRRQELGLSQSEMARRTGMGQSTLSRLESGQHFERDLGLRFLPVLADGYEIPFGDLIAHLFPGHARPEPERGLVGPTETAIAVAEVQSALLEVLELLAGVRADTHVMSERIDALERAVHDQRKVTQTELERFRQEIAVARGTAEPDQRRSEMAERAPKDPTG